MYCFYGCETRYFTPREMNLTKSVSEQTDEKNVWDNWKGLKRRK